MNKTILFLDDEKSILTSIQRVFFNQGYDIHTFTSAEAALRSLKERSYSVIISDMKMPGMNGIEFLNRARIESPDSIRIILSAFTETDTIMEAINSSNIWRFITKPWDTNDLITAIKNAIDFYEESMEKKRLIVELQQLNASLEIKVAQRTQTLNNVTVLQNMVLENAPLDTILKKACEDITAFIEGVTVIIHTKQNNTITTLKDNQLDEGQRNKLDLVYTEKAQSITETQAIIPLQKGMLQLGALIITHKSEQNIQQVLPQLSGTISALTLALSFSAIVHDSPSLINSIDDLMENIE